MNIITEKNEIVSVDSVNLTMTEESSLRGVNEKDDEAIFNPRKMLNRIYQRLFIMGWYEGTVPIFSKEKMGLSPYNKEGNNGR